MWYGKLRIGSEWRTPCIAHRNDIHHKCVVFAHFWNDSSFLNRSLMLDRIIATHCWKQHAVIDYSLYVSAKIRNLLFYLKVLIACADPSIIWVYLSETYLKIEVLSILNFNLIKPWQVFHSFLLVRFSSLIRF